MFMKNYFLLLPAFLMGSLQVMAQEFEDVKKPPVNQQNRGQGGAAENEPEADCNQDLEFDEGANMVFHMKTGKPFSGVCRTYYEDGSMEREVRFQKGKEDGESITLYNKRNDKGQQVVMAVLNHKMGLPDGTWEYYYESGKRAWVQNWIDGKKNGSHIYYYEDGQPKREESYKDDLKEGKYKEYYPGGKIKLEVDYKQGIIEGMNTSYYENGQISYQGKYTKGKEDGEVTTYFDKGQMSSQSFFKAGIPDGEWHTWYDDGHERTVLHYLEGKKHGECKSFYKDGQVKTIEQWVNGKRTSIEAFDEFGNQLDPDEIKN